MPVPLLLVGLLLAAGCSREKRRVIAVIPKSTSHLFWVATEAGARAAGQRFNVEILWNGPASETDYSRQIQIVDSMISRRVDGIALAAADRQGLVGSVDRAVAQGIPVTIFDSGLDSENYLTFVATNNYEAGRMAARELAGLVGGKGLIAVVLHVPGSRSSMDREKGFEEAIAREFPDIRIVAQQFGMSDRAKAMAVTENILTANPDLAGLFASAEPSSMGAALALKSRGLSGKIKFVSFDSSASLVEDLRGGVISAMVVQDPFRIGFEAVKTLVDKMEGKTPPKRMDLDARIVHARDLDQPDVRRLLSLEVKNNRQ
jgi:ribose transport system substrate-binding protein